MEEATLATLFAEVTLLTSEVKALKQQQAQLVAALQAANPGVNWSYGSPPKEEEPSFYDGPAFFNHTISDASYKPLIDTETNSVTDCIERLDIENNGLSSSSSSSNSDKKWYDNDEDNIADYPMCPGCKTDAPGQMAHMGYGGCLDDGL